MIRLPKSTCLAAILLFGTTTLSASAGTSEKSQAAAPQVPASAPAARPVDPLYSRIKVTPTPDTLPGAPWLYADTELEAWKLKQMRSLVTKAKLRVRYPGNYYEPKNRAYFRIPASVDARYPHMFDLNAYGAVNVYLDGSPIYTAGERSTPHKIKVPSAGSLVVALSTAQEPPALRIDKGYYATGNSLWQASADSTTWSHPCAYPRHKDGTLPHRAETPLVRLQPVSHSDTLYDFGRELFGFIVLTADEKPEFFAGESVLEAIDTAARPREQSFALEPAGKGKWRSVTPVAFRYAYLPGGSVKAVECDTYSYPARYLGDFQSADTLLNDIWFKSAYTLRLCMHEFLIDGIKRDRLPWAGDLAMSMMANAYTFADREIVRRTIAMLGREGIAETDINDIADYSLWWLISQDRYQLFFGDKVHLEREWPRIQKALKVLESRCDQQGFLTDSIRWLFIDWVYVEKECALQVLWWWAQRSAVALAERMDDQPMAAYWRAKSNKLGAELLARGYDLQRQAWRGKPDGQSAPNRHANFLAVISGLAPASQYPGILNILADTSVMAVGTPYMAGFEYMALTRMRAADRMLHQMRDYWGGMIRQGATSFWEGYDVKEDSIQQYAFYKRPFGKSLCHAWSSGPAALIPSELLGIRPLTDGWEIFEVDPQVPASLQPIEAIIPTPRGEIKVSLNNGLLRVGIPQGCTAQFRGKSYTTATPIEARL